MVALDDIFQPRDNLGFMSFHVDFYQIDTIWLLCSEYMVAGIDTDQFFLIKVITFQCHEIPVNTGGADVSLAYIDGCLIGMIGQGHTKQGKIFYRIVFQVAD